MADYPATIARRVEHEIEIKKSRFITHLEPVGSVAEADEFIAEIRKRFWDARHNCVAMITGATGDQARSSDDGEPSGTAGVPMMEVLKRRGMTDLVAVVTRYFGGIKLGAGGLVRAYGNAVSEALDHAQLVYRRSLTQATIEVAHADAGRFENLLREWVTHHDATLGETAYGQHAVFEAWIPADQLAALTADVATWSQGSLAPVFGETRVVDIAA
ncbi:IMPACT family member YvyE [Microbacterium sorbitolivorans]|uniref:YigZ family protein n=1 Tax=Microbacterium sorbitolivorans TaxID=1867410 RepID=A0A367Y3I2_9MICO|nr:YigZ family protein [Microbacterium sorbitolivorans]RCK60169.1 YigZ family protein [Microbacterium sorbitolivorans]GGF48443.1 IMPACT family member YvyE [Microbacterium sorbitolivorans]